MILIILLVIIFILEQIWENRNPKKNDYEIITHKKINKKNLRILHISDLHNYEFGQSQLKLKRLITNEYDFVFITGDLIDRRYPDVKKAIKLIDYLCLKYRDKIYFTTGNHEKGSEYYSQLKEELLNRDIIILDNDNKVLDDINIIGLEDPSEYESINIIAHLDYENIVNNKLKGLIKDNKFNILLSHRPEYFNIYKNHNVDLVFSGHTHGGQVKVFNRGLYASEQGFLAKYAGGIFVSGNTTMVNSRGLGNNFPFTMRVFNRPELIEINLVSKLVE